MRTHLRGKEKRDAQKIFKFQRDGIEMAYALCGNIATEDRSFDLQKILADELMRIDTGMLRTCYELIEVLAEHIQHHMRQSGQRPVAYVPFFGYFRSKPSWIGIEFRPSKGFIDRLYDLQEYLTDGPDTIPPNSFLPYLPEGAGNVYGRKDPRFPILWTLPDPAKRSLDESVDFVIEYVKVSEQAEIAEVGPDQAMIGGRIHAAVVRSDSGFEWCIPPLQERPNDP